MAEENRAAEEVQYGSRVPVNVRGSRYLRNRATFVDARSPEAKKSGIRAAHFDSWGNLVKGVAASRSIDGSTGQEVPAGIAIKNTERPPSLSSRVRPDGLGGRFNIQPQKSYSGTAFSGVARSPSRQTSPPRATDPASAFTGDRKSVTVAVDPRHAGPGQLTTEDVARGRDPGLKRMPAAGEKFVQGVGIVKDPTWRPPSFESAARNIPARTAYSSAPRFDVVAAAPARSAFSGAPSSAYADRQTGQSQSGGLPVPAASTDTASPAYRANVERLKTGDEVARQMFGGTAFAPVDVAAIGKKVSSALSSTSGGGVYERAQDRPAGGPVSLMNPFRRKKPLLAGN